MAKLNKCLDIIVNAHMCPQQRSLRFGPFYVNLIESWLLFTMAAAPRVQLDYTEKTVNSKIA